MGSPCWWNDLERDHGRAPSVGRFLGDRREVRGRCAVPEFLWFREHFTRQASYIDTNNINSALRYIWLSKFLFWHRPAHATRDVEPFRWARQHVVHSHDVLTLPTLRNHCFHSVKQRVEFERISAVAQRRLRHRGAAAD